MSAYDAGSEKTKTDVATTHGQMIESNNINRSLLVLGTTNRSIMSVVLLGLRQSELILQCTSALL